MQLALPAYLKALAQLPGSFFRVLTAPLKVVTFEHQGAKREGVLTGGIPIEVQ
jgi:hypothetical protein